MPISCDSAACGVYVIRGPGGIYVGSTVKFKQRAFSHASALKHGKHGNPALQRDYAKYGPDAFRFEPVLTCDIATARAVERDTIRAIVGPGCYNVPEHPPNTTGMKLSDEHKRKLSKIMRESPANVAALAKGRARRAENDARRRAAGLPTRDYSAESMANLAVGAAVAREALMAKSAARTAAVAALRAQGLRTGQIASALGISRSCVQRHVNGLPRRAKREAGL